MKRFIIISGFLLVTALLFGQFSLSGTIAGTNAESIEFANISLFDSLGEQFIKGTTSDSLGRYTFAGIEKGNYLLDVQHISFREYRLQLSVAEDLILETIYLMSSETSLEEIVVTAKVPVIEKVGDNVHFNISSSPLNSGYDGVEILEFAPNVWVDGDGQVSLRQSTPVIMINGRKINLPANEVSDYLKNIASEDILRIEIQTAIDASQDAESAGGVINFILKKNPLGFNSTLRTHYQFKAEQVQAGYAGLNFNYGAAQWNLYGSYNHSSGLSKSNRVYETFYTQAEEYLNTTEAQDFNSDRHKYQLGILWEPFKNQEFGLEIFGHLADFDRSEGSELYLSDLKDTLVKGTSISNNLSDNDILNSVFNYKIKLDTLGSFFRLISDFTNHRNKQFFNFQSIYSNNFLADNTERNDFSAESNIFILQPEWNKHFQNGIKLIAGAKITQINRDNDLFVEVLDNENWVVNDRTSILNYQEKVVAGFFSFSQSFGEDYFIKMGLRAENTSLERREDQQVIPLTRNYINWFPTFYLSRDLKNNKSISFSYNRGLNRPSFGLLTNKFTKVNDFNYSTGNPDLQPEFRGAYDLTFQINQSSFSLFLNNTVDAINGVYLLEDQITTYIPLNDGVQRSFGGSYNRSGKINTWWFLSSNLYLFHRNFKNSQGEVSFPQTTFNFNLSNNFKISPTTSIDLSGNYSGPRKDAFYEADATYQINVLLKQSFFDKRLNCRIYLNDIFDLRDFGNVRPFEDFYTVYYSKPITRGIRFWMSYKLANRYEVKSGKNKSGNDAKGHL